MLLKLPLKLNERISLDNFQRFVSNIDSVNSGFVYLRHSHGDFIPDQRYAYGQIIGYEFSLNKSYVIFHPFFNRLELFGLLATTKEGGLTSCSIIPGMLVNMEKGKSDIYAIVAYYLSIC